MPEIQESVPKYLQIAGHIRDQISRKELRPGDEVPSERQLATDWRVARPTAAKALEALRSQGLVESRQGMGTFVRDEHVNARARDRYASSRQFGRVYVAGERADIISADIMSAPGHVATGLNVETGAPVIRRVRVIHNEDGPIELSTSWFVGELASVAPDLLSLARIPSGTLSYVESATGRRAKYARDAVSARLATPEERGHLLPGAPEPVAVLVYHHVAFDKSDQPLEFAESLYPPGSLSLDAEYPI